MTKGLCPHCMLSSTRTRSHRFKARSDSLDVGVGVGPGVAVGVGVSATVGVAVGLGVGVGSASPGSLSGLAMTAKSIKASRTPATTRHVCFLVRLRRTSAPLRSGWDALRRAVRSARAHRQGGRMPIPASCTGSQRPGDDLPNRSSRGADYQTAIRCQATAQRLCGQGAGASLPLAPAAPCPHNAG